MTATLYKRLKVDNGIKIWHYSGALIYQLDSKELYQVSWKPEEATLWTERTGQSPPPTSIATVATTPKKAVGAYRPPGARSDGAPLVI